MHTEVTLNQLRSIIEVAESGSINAAAQNLYMSQSTLSTSIKDAERELGIEIFHRSNRGITLTSEGIEFLRFARQVMEQMDLLNARYSEHSDGTGGHFAISSQHYAFSLDAFIALCEELDADEYDFEFRETRTGEIIEDVRTYRSELGILFISAYNERVLLKVFKEAGLEFVALFKAKPHIFVGENHPLAGRDLIEPEDLQDYPRYSFEQGTENSFYYSEEPLSHLPHKRNIAISDRGTLSNLLTHYKGYTISTGVLSKEMNTGIAAIPLDSDEIMTVGYIHHSARPLSPLATRYLSILRNRIAENSTVTELYGADVVQVANDPQDTEQDAEERTIL